MSTGKSRPFVELLALRSCGPRQFVALPRERSAAAVFGGQLLAQALMASGLTVGKDRLPHSVHAYFLRPAQADRQIEYEVLPKLDGRRVSHRAVRATQDGREVFTMNSSFRMGASDEHWQPGPLPVRSVPDQTKLGPGSAPDVLEHIVASDSFEFRFPMDADQPSRPCAFHPCWIRYVGEVDLDPLRAACAWAFVSDIGVVSGACRVEHVPYSYQGVSVDHAIWFHQRVAAAEWLRFEVMPRGQFGDRGLAHGSFHDEQGRLATTIMQEAAYSLPHR